jgi:hypothetical protein
VNTQQHIESAIANGESNRRAIELVKNWCAHVEVKKFGGVGLVEQQTGLPIGPHSLTCPHAAAAGFAGADLTFVALDFHDRNCVGCTKRKPVRLPNISALLQQRETARAAEAKVTARRESERAARQAARDAVRQAMRAGLAPPSSDVVDQIEELDHCWDKADADRLVETAKLAPEVFTPSLVEHAFALLESDESWFDDAGLRLLKALDVDRTRLTRCALLCIPRHLATETAAGILLENLPLVVEELISGAVPNLISMAYPRRLPLAGDDREDREPIAAPLLRLHELFPAAVEAAIKGLLDSRDPYTIGEAARGIAVLAGRDKALPGRFARSLASKLVRDRRLLQASDHYDGDGETVNEVREALALAFEAAPVETDKLLKAFLSGASETGEARILSVYGQSLRPARFDDAQVTEANRVALKGVIWHAAKTDRQEVLREIENLISGAPWGLAMLASEEVEKLLGAAILIQDKLDHLEREPTIHDPTGLTGLKRFALQTSLQHVRDGLVNWAAAGAGESAAAARAYSEVLGGLPGEGRNALKANLVSHLDKLMQTTDGLNAALPHLYTALVGASVALRASAAYAIGELRSRQRDDAPGLIFEAFTALLLDPYRAVHQTAVHALRRLWLSDPYAPKIRSALLALIFTYGRDRNDDRFLVECLDFYIDHYAKPEEFSGKLGDWVLSLLLEIEPYIVAHEIISFGCVLSSHDRFVELLTRLTLDDHAWDISHEEITRAFRDVPWQRCAAR